MKHRNQVEIPGRQKWSVAHCVKVTDRMVCGQRFVRMYRNVHRENI